MKHRMHQFPGNPYFGCQRIVPTNIFLQSILRLASSIDSLKDLFLLQPAVGFVERENQRQRCQP